jgi:hypothetical protein
VTETFPTALPAPIEAHQSPRQKRARQQSRASHHAARAEERKAIKGFWARAEKFSDENRIAAEIIVSDVERYGGEGSALVQWARRAIQREAEKQAAAA